MASPVSTPVGYRFHPTDEELIDHYLKHKLFGNDPAVNNVITEIDVCQVEPWDLPAFSKVKSDDPEWFFFSPVGLKFTKDTRNRYNRKTKAGFWKPTGKDRKIKNRGTNNIIGTKKTLVFYEGRSSRAVKTNWVIHEYHVATFLEDKATGLKHEVCLSYVATISQGGFVLCRLMDKDDKKAEKGIDTSMHDVGEPSSQIAADFESQEMENGIQSLFTLPKEVSLESIFATPSQTQEPSSQVSSFPNANFGKENGILHIPSETIEEKNNLDKFLNEILADEDAFISDETIAEEIDGKPLCTGKAVLLPRVQLKNESLTTYFGMSAQKRARGDGESSNVEVNSNRVNSLAENRPLKEERLDFIDMICCLKGEVIRLNLLVSTLAEELVAVKLEAQVEDMEKDLADVRSQIRSAAAYVEKLIAVKDEENERLVNLKRITTNVGLDLESEWPSRKTEVKEIQESALQNHVRGFDRALAQVRLIYPDINLSGVDIFNDIVNGQLLDPSMPLATPTFP